MRSALVREYAEDEPGARTIVFEGPSQGEGFQIFVVPYDKSEITRERFLTDDPSGVRRDEWAGRNGGGRHARQDFLLLQRPHREYAPTLRETPYGYAKWSNHGGCSSARSSAGAGMCSQRSAAATAGMPISWKPSVDVG